MNEQASVRRTNADTWPEMTHVSLATDLDGTIGGPLLDRDWHTDTTNTVAARVATVTEWNALLLCAFNKLLADAGNRRPFGSWQVH